MSEEKKGAERLDPTSTDAMHWAECFCEQVEINSEDEVHIEPEFLMAYFANFWAAVNDPLQNTIESQAAEISALRERVKELEGLVSVARCPDQNCDNNGTTALEVFRTVAGCCNQPLPSGECCGMAVPEQEVDIEPAPCEWCHNKKILLSTRRKEG